MSDGLTFAPGNPGNAAGFTQSLAQYLSLADSSAFVVGAGEDMAIAGWFYPTITPVFYTKLVTKTGGTTAGDEWYLQINPTGPAWEFGYSNGAGYQNADSGRAFVQDAWSFVYADYDHSTGGLRIQVNGNAIESFVGTGPMHAGSNGVTIGSDTVHGATGFFDGRIDALAFWKRRLSGAEIAALYNSGSGARLTTGPVSLRTNLVVWWEMDNDTGIGWLDAWAAHHLTAGGRVASVTGKT